MSEKRQYPDGIEQPYIDYEVEHHLELVTVLLERLGGGSSDQVSVGYVKPYVPEEEEEFSPMGLSLLKVAQSVAWDSATYLYEEVTAVTTGLQDTTLLYDLQRFLTVAAVALRGVDVNENCPGVSPTYVATCLRSMAWDLQKRVEERKEAAQRVERKETAQRLQEKPRYGRMTQGEWDQIRPQIQKHMEELPGETIDAAKTAIGAILELRAARAGETSEVAHV